VTEADLTTGSVMSLIEVAQISFGIVKWLGYVLVVYAVWRRTASATHAPEDAATVVGRVIGAATLRTGLGLATGVLLVRQLDFEASVGPNPLAVVALILGTRFLEWAAVSALFFAVLRSPRTLMRASVQSTGLSFALDIPATFLTLVVGYATTAIHMC
jgi:hypothetical protein